MLLMLQLYWCQICLTVSLPSSPPEKMAPEKMAPEKIVLSLAVLAFLQAVWDGLCILFLDSHALAAFNLDSLQLRLPQLKCYSEVLFHALTYEKFFH